MMLNMIFQNENVSGHSYWLHVDTWLSELGLDLISRMRKNIASIRMRAYFYRDEKVTYQKND